MIMKEVNRRSFLKVIGGAGAATVAFEAIGRSALALSNLKPADDVSKAYSYRSWEDLYRKQWTWDKIVKGTHSYNCLGQCLLDVYVKDGIVWREEQSGIYPQIREDMPDPNPRGCDKGCIHSRQMYQGDRLLYPLKRIGQRGEGKWLRISWEQAATEIADKLLDIIQKHGVEHIQFQGSGWGTISGLGLSSLCDLLGAVKPGGYEESGDAYAGAWLTYAGWPPEISHDTFFKKYIMLHHMNYNATKIPDAHYLWEARYNSGKVVVVTPDLNPTAIHADLWLPIKPGTDNAFRMAMMHIIINEGLVDIPYIKEQTDLPFLVRKDTGKYLRESDTVEEGRKDNFYLWDSRTDKPVLAPGAMGHKDKTLKLGNIDPALEGEFQVDTLSGKVSVRPVFHIFKARVQEWTPEKAASISGLHADDIVQVSREFATLKPATIIYGQDQNKRFHGELEGRAVALLLALTGNIGRGGTPGGSGVRWNTGMMRVQKSSRQASVVRPTLLYIWLLWTEFVLQVQSIQTPADFGCDCRYNS